MPDGELVSDGDDWLAPEPIVSQAPEAPADGLEVSEADALALDMSDAPALDISDAGGLEVSEADALAVSDADALALDMSEADGLEVSDGEALADMLGLIETQGVALGVAGAPVAPPTFELGELTDVPHAAASRPMASRPPIVRGRRIMLFLSIGLK